MGFFEKMQHTPEGQMQRSEERLSTLTDEVRAQRRNAEGALGKLSLEHEITSGGYMDRIMHAQNVDQKREVAEEFIRKNPFVFKGLDLSEDELTPFAIAFAELMHERSGSVH